MASLVAEEEAVASRQEADTASKFRLIKKIGKKKCQFLILMQVKKIRKNL